VLPCQVLLNEPQSTEVKAGECVWDDLYRWFRKQVYY
jgi:hypothetical protein